MDPKSIALIAGAVVQLVITWWQSRQTALALSALLKWQLEVVQKLSAIETTQESHEREISRLRDRET